VLFLARHATNFSEERKRQYGYHVVYHEVLLKTLRDIGLKVKPASDFRVLFQKPDYNFLYGIHSHAIFDGHELLAPSIAAYHGVPFLGSPAPVRAMSEDKFLAKKFAASVGIDVAKDKVFNPADTAMQGFSMPGSWVLKPRGGIASDALMKVDSEAEWDAALKAAADPKNEGRDFMAEEFVPGINLTVPVIEGFPPETFACFIERGRAGDNMLTKEGKRGMNPDYASEPYGGPGAAEASAAAAKLAAEISPFDYARFDFRYDTEAKRLVFLEMNIACNMSPASVVRIAAAQHGIDYGPLVAHVFTHSLRRQRVSKKA
jgi:D-alanine-D-alanine ligase